MNIIEKVKYVLSMKDIGPVMQKYGKISVLKLACKFVTAESNYGV